MDQERREMCGDRKSQNTRAKVKWRPEKNEKEKKKTQNGRIFFWFRTKGTLRETRNERKKTRNRLFF